MPINWHSSNYRQNYRYRKIGILKLSKNYRYRKMHQIWSDKFIKSQTHISQENVRTNTLSCLLTMRMLCLFDPFLHFFDNILHFQSRFFVAKSEFCQLFEKIIKNIIESRYISIFQIIGKLSISKLECLKLSVI